MSRALTSVLLCSLASGCYCSHLPERFHYGADAATSIDAADHDAQSRREDATASDAPPDAYCERPLGTIDDCASCGDRCGWECEPDGCNDALEISLGGRHSCALRDRGVVCWGSNFHGQLGNDSLLQSAVPVRVRGLPDDIVQVDAGVDHACARTGAGAVYCWGSNELGALGDGTLTDRLVAVPVMDLGGTATDVSAGGGTCAVLDGGEVRCWGLNDQGQVGDGTVGGVALRPTRVAVVTDATDVEVGELHACVRRASGEVFCWGDNSRGQLGNDNMPTDSAGPVQALGVSNTTMLALGAAHSCAITSPPGSVRCWGQNNTGQIGDGTTVDRGSPFEIPILSREVVTIVAGGGHTCAMLGRNMYCWGSGASGELGTGTTTRYLEPVGARDLGEVLDLGAGGAHTCAVLLGGTVSCWGLNDSKQAGSTSSMDQLAPVVVPPPG